MEVFLALIRHGLTTLGGVLISKGWLDGGEMEQLIGAVVTILGVGLSIWAKRSNKDQPGQESWGENVPSFLVLGLLSLALMANAGCTNRIAADGPYQGDQVLYQADRTIVGAYDLLHTFVKWEFEHRHALTKFPEVTRAADHVRQNAERWITSATALRDAYKANPTDENRAALSHALDVLQAALNEASRYLQEQAAR